MVKAEVSLCLIKYYAMKSHGSGHISQCILFTMALNRSEWSVYVSATLLPVGQWVKPRGSLKAVDKTEVSATHQSLNLQSSHSND